MKLFVDCIDEHGMYRAATGYQDVDAKAVAPGKPPLLRLPRGRSGRARRTRRFFHIERSEFAASHALRKLDVRDFHTVVVIDVVDPLFREPGTIRVLWEITGGPTRKQRFRRRSFAGR